MAEQVLQKNESELRPRTLFMTILCILSFLACTWIFWNSITHMSGSSEDLTQQNALITLIGVIFSLIGTALMWSMRQFGFWLFFAGSIFATAGPIVIFGIDHVISFSTGYPTYLSLLFLILFATNYRRMD